MEQKIMQEKIVNGKTRKLTLINVIAALFTTIFLVDSLVPAASTGASTVIWYVIFGLAFYIPYGLITAEFSSKIPEEGGVYAWVRKTLGIGTSKRVAWYYWVNVGIWAPSISIYIAQLIEYLWFPGGIESTNPWLTALIALAFMWGSLAFSYFPIVDNTHLYTSATIGKITIVLFLIVGALIALGSGQKSATNFTQIPDEFAHAGGIILFFPALVYNILGLEAVAGETKSIKNPSKILPRAMIITVLTLLVFFIVSTLAIQYIFNTANGLDLTGIIAGFEHAFGNSEMGSKVLINLLGIIFIYTMFVETMGWVSGANAGATEAAHNGDFPTIFKNHNRLGMPFKSSIILGAIGSVELIIFTAIQQLIGGDTGATIFWSLFATSSNILFLSYFLMFSAYIKAKARNELASLSGFSLNKILGITLAAMALIILALTWFLLIWAPGYDLLLQTLPILISIIIALLAGELIFYYRKRRFGEGVKNGS